MTTATAQDEKKITLATLKSFVRKNSGKLHINVKSAFDGMTDCCESQQGGFQPAQPTERNVSNTLGILGAWIVRGSRDYFHTYNDGTFKGIEVYNCCGKFILAVKAA